LLPPHERIDQLEEEKHETLRRPSTYELASLVALVSGHKLVGQDYLETVNTMLAVWDHCGRALCEEVNKEINYVRLKTEHREGSRAFVGPFPVAFEEGLRLIFGGRRDRRYKLLRECLREIELCLETFDEMRAALMDPEKLALWKQEQTRREEAGLTASEREARIDTRFKELKTVGIDRAMFDKLCGSFEVVQKKIASEKGKNAGLKRWSQKSPGENKADEKN